LREMIRCWSTCFAPETAKFSSRHTPFSSATSILLTRDFIASIAAGLVIIVRCPGMRYLEVFVTSTGERLSACLSACLPVVVGAKVSEKCYDRARQQKRKAQLGVSWFRSKSEVRRRPGCGGGQLDITKRSNTLIKALALL
jgi:hypothetical protein